MVMPSTAPLNQLNGSAVAPGGKPRAPFSPSSWLEGLGLGAGSPPRQYDCWLRGGGASSSHLSSASTHQRAAAPAAIVDDIRNDRELFFADDEPMPMLSSSPVTRPSSVSGPSLARPRHYPSNGGAQNASFASIESHSQRRRQSASAVGGLTRRTSHQKMTSLQREVDMALEYFSQETEDGLDDADCDYGDAYLNRHALNRHASATNAGKLLLSEGGGGSSDTSSMPGTAALSMATSVVTDCEGEFGDFQSKLISYSDRGSSGASTPTSAATPGPGGLMSLQHKTKSILSLPLSLLSSQTAMNCVEEEDDDDAKFENVMSRELNRICLYEEQKKTVDFGAHPSLRNAMEPFLRIARIRREEAREQVLDTFDKVMMPEEEQCPSHRASTSSDHSLHIGSTYGVPYPALRNESSFLFDEDSFPLRQVLAETMGVDHDLSKIHLTNPLKKDKGRLMAPLRDRGRRRRFHQCFDSFVTSQVIPLLHSQALSKGVFYTNRHQLQRGKPQRIVYRYQAFPSINIVRPGECSTDPHCDMAQGHSIGNISYHVPLTPTFGTNAVYTESRPGREDWHPLSARSPGLGFQFDGARCLHFNLKNETDSTRVSLNFRIAIVRAPDVGDAMLPHDPDDQLCCPELLRDRFSLENPGFYDEVVVNVGDVPRSFLPGPVATKRRGGISVVG